MVVHLLPDGISANPLNGRRPSHEEYLSFRDVWNFLVQHMKTFLIFMALGLAVGMIYLANTKPTYLATTRLVMDPEQGRISWRDAATGTIIIEAAEIASQVEIIKSESVAEAVIRKLDLTQDSELLDGRSVYSIVRSVFSPATYLFGSSAKTDTGTNEETEADLMRRAMAAFLGRVSVDRVGQSYVLEIGYTSTSPQKAALVANALAQAYIQVGMNDRTDTAKSGAKWLESRLLDVGEKAREASILAEKFRATNNITVVSNSATLDQQQISELSSQLLAARAATAAELANLDSLHKAMNNGEDLALGDPSVDGALQKLKDDLRMARARLETLKSRYDAGNPAIATAEDDVRRVNDAIRQEYARVEAVHRANLSAAQTRERLSDERLAALTKQAVSKNQAMAELSEIESRANTYKRIYETLLQQLVGTTQTQSYPLGKARIVTAASAPLTKKWPKTSIIIPFSGMMGLSIGLLIAILKQTLDHRASSASYLRRELGINSLGNVPLFLPPNADGAKVFGLPASVAPLGCVLREPYSPFAEALRIVKDSVDSTLADNGGCVIGITSVSPGEGKTTLSINLAQLYRNEGRSVLLIDADFISCCISRMANAFPKELALEILPSLDGAQATGAEMPQMVREAQLFAAKKGQALSRRKSHMDLVGAVVPVLTSAQIKEQKTSHQHYSHLSALKSTIDAMRDRYEIVIVDMSAFEDSADTRAVCTFVDGIIVVLGKAKKMTIEQLSSALSTFGKARLTIVGSIFNRSSQR